MPSGAVQVGGTYPMMRFYLVLLLGFVNLLSGTQAAKHTVGGLVGWSVPSSSQTDWYSEVWAKSISFELGDVLVFSYSADDNVYELADEEDFATCKLDTIGVWYSGSTNITLTNAGTYYFVCGNEHHCKLGMKLQVNVKAAATPVTPRLPLLLFTDSTFAQILSGLFRTITSAFISITAKFGFSPSYHP